MLNSILFWVVFETILKFIFINEISQGSQISGKSENFTFLKLLNCISSVYFGGSRMAIRPTGVYSMQFRYFADFTSCLPF